MKNRLEILFVIFYIFIGVSVLLSLPATHKLLFADEDTTTYLLIDDFSWRHQYNNFSALNPYWYNATGQLWNASGYSNPGEIQYHTNNLGYYESSGPNNGGLAQVEANGFRSIAWYNQTVWWYTLLALTGQSRDVSSFYYLNFRVKGNNGGETFRVKLETAGNFSELNVTNYLTGGISTQWQTARIPLGDFNLTNLNQGKAITFVFNADNAPTPKKIYYDDISFMPQFDPVPAGDGVIKPPSKGPVKIALTNQTRAITVNDRPYLVKGVCYQPTPIGQSPDKLYDNQGQLIPFEPYVWDYFLRDLTLLSQMGVNTLRTWIVFADPMLDMLHLLDAANSYNMKAWAGFWIPYEISFLNDWAKDHIEQDFRKYVAGFMGHPGLLGWAIGNEGNYFNFYDWHGYDFSNRLAKTAYQEEGAAYHPVALVEGDVGNIGNQNFGADDAHLNYVDVIGSNVYRGKTFGNFFSTLSANTAKPIWISEYGIDAYNNITQQENQLQQTYYDVNAWIDAVRNKNVCIGAALMEYSDEWWKDPFLRYIVPDLSIHNFGGFVHNSFPDLYMNEEWWGIVSVQDNGNLPDLVFPRDLFNHLYSTTIGGRVNLITYPNATGIILKRAGGIIYTTNLDIDGLYYFTQLPPGKYSVGISSTPPTISPVIRVAINAGETVVVDF